MSKEWPEPWRGLLEARGIHSRHEFARRADVAVQTIVRLVDGIGEPRQETVTAVAAALSVEVDVVWQLAGYNRSDHGPFSLPAESSRLTEIQREAILAVVRAMLSPEREEVMGDDRDPAPIASLPERKRPITGIAEAVVDAQRTRQNEARKVKGNDVTNG